MLINNFHKKHIRGSSSIQEAEKRPDESVALTVLKRKNRPRALPLDTSESVSDNWVKGLRSIREDPEDSLCGDQREDLTAQENKTESQSDDERWQDDGGESAEVV